MLIIIVPVLLLSLAYKQRDLATQVSTSVIVAAPVVVVVGGGGGGGGEVLTQLTQIRTCSCHL